MESLACFAKATTTAFLGIRPYINPRPQYYLVPSHSRSYTQSSALTRPLSLNLSANPRHGISRISCAPPNPSSYEQDEEEKEVERLLHGYEGELRMLEHSFRGNGIMTVHAFPSSFPSKEMWPSIEMQLQERFEKLPDNPFAGQIKIHDFEWRVLKFDHKSVEAVSQAICVSIDSHPAKYFESQMPHCLALPYVKSMLTTGLTALCATKFDLGAVVSGSRHMRILCIGGGGFTIPLFMASTVKGAIVDVVERDEGLVSLSNFAMGFPTIVKGAIEYNTMNYFPEPAEKQLEDIMQKMFWNDIKDRLFVHRADGESFVCDSLIKERSDGVLPYYDLVFVDAYNGDGLFPFKFRNRDGKFLKALSCMVHPTHGTVVVNLRERLSYSSERSALGIENMKTAVAYRDSLSFRLSQEQSHDTVAFTTGTPKMRNVTLGVSRGFHIEDGQSISQSDYKTSHRLLSENLLSKSHLVQNLFKFPFDCSQFVARELQVIK